MSTYKLHHQYRTGATSLDQAKEFQHILDKGVYFGFDAITDGGGPGIKIVVNHEVTGKNIIDQDLVLSTKAAIVRSPQGTVIHVFGATDPLPVSDNASGSVRRDLVILEHEHILTIGGAQPVISIIEGTPGAGIPALSNPSKQVILGYLEVAPGATAFAGVTYTPVERPGFAGDMDNMKLSKVQQNARTKAMYKKGTFQYYENVDENHAILWVKSDGNLFEVPVPDGQRKVLNIKFTDIAGNNPPVGTHIYLKSNADDEPLAVVSIFDNPQGFGGLPTGAGTKPLGLNDVLELIYVNPIDSNIELTSIAGWRVLNFLEVIVGKNLYSKLAGLLTVDTDIADLADALVALTEQYTPNINGENGKGSTDVGGSTFTIAGNNMNFHRMGRLCTLNLRGQSNFTITGTPNVLYISLAHSSLPTFVEGPYAATMLLTDAGSSEILFALLNTAQNRLELRKADGSAFTNTSGRIYGQITGALSE